MRGIKLLGLAWLAVAAAPLYAASPAVDEATTLINKGQFEQALQRLDGHLKSAPQDAEARFTRGLVLVRLNRNDDAAKAFSELTRDYPQLPEPYNNLAVIYAQQGDYDKARDALESALQTHPSYPVAHENLGDIYAALAAAAYNRALSLDGGNAGVRAKISLINQLDSLADSGATVAARGPAPATAETGPAISINQASIAEVVQGWAAAWSNKDVEKYLGYYAPNFAPEGGAARQAWEAQRRARIVKPKEIKVAVSELKVQPLAADRVQATFQQDYASDVLSNRSGKVLELVQVQGQWKIRREYSR
ncbi:MAG TPA: tetratricopeptide repeat protein [Verrucomicrobiae bacterium]|nr:tetratricopeptide repeat protein [Verrucomicrobiae bacterium]